MSFRITNKDAEEWLTSTIKYDEASKEMRDELLYVTRTLLEAVELMIDCGVGIKEKSGGPSGLSSKQRKKARAIIEEWGG